MVRFRFIQLSLLTFFAGGLAAFAQTPDAAESEAVRVTVSLNDDGSRTTYEFNKANHTAVATTRESDGRMRGKIRYALDEAGRFTKGDIFGPDGRLRFKAVYKYDRSGRLTQELHFGRDDSIVHKIVYSYDAVGHQTSYSVYDASGKLIGQTKLLSSAGKPAKKR